MSATAVLTGPDGKLHEIVRVDQDSWFRDGPLEYMQYRQDLDAHIVELSNQKRLIYHYTSLAGFYGIVASGAIWASDIRMMNDSSEIKFGLGVIRKHVLASHAALVDAAQLDSALNPGRVWQFASSFSLSKDQLSQWRAYGAQVAVAIGFDADHVEASARAFNGELREVVYPANEDTSAFADHLGPIVDGLQEMRNVEDQSQLNKQSESVARRAVRLASVIKHPSFAEERELRMLFARDSVSQIDFRASPNSLIPYLRVPIDNKALDRAVRRKFTNRLGMVEILVWPNCVDNQVLDAIDMLLSKAGGALIRRSTSPYRT